MMTRSVGGPYPGSRPFAESDFDFFFGRSDDAETLAHLWQVNRLTLVVGPTGSGKTSLLAAGVLPLVRYGHGEALPLGRVSYGSSYPAAALPEHNPFTLSLLRSWAPGEPETRLVGLTVRDFVRRQAERCEGPVLAAIDQAEDLLADSGLRGMHRRDYLEDLTTVVREETRLHLLIVIRASAADQFRALGGVRFSVPPLSNESALEAVTGPLHETSRTFALEAAESLVTDLRTSYISLAGGDERRVVADNVPPDLLQVVCAQLWESLPAELEAITPRAIRAYGDADRALTAHYGRVIAAVADEHHLEAARLQSWLIRTFITDVGTSGMVHEGLLDTAGMPNAVLRALENRHLLCSEWRSGSRWYQLLSQRLIEPLRRAAVDWPTSTDPAELLRAAERALTLGDLALAKRHCQEILVTAPPDDFRIRAEANSLLGNVAYERAMSGEVEPYYQEAEDYYRQAARFFEAVGDTAAVAQEYAAVGQTLLAQGHLSDAVRELEIAVRRVPSDYVVRAELAWAHWQRGEAGAAEAIFTDILAEDAGNASALRGRGEILADRGRGREAMRDLSRTVGHDRPSTRAARGLALAELGDRGGAVKEIEAALEQAPRNGLVLLYAARAESLGGDRAYAAELAKQAIDATDPPIPLHQQDAALKLADSREDGA